MKIGIIGCGHMGSAIAKALIAKKIWRVFVGSPKRPHFPAQWATDNRKTAKKTDIIIIAVKPSVVPAVLAEIKPCLKPGQILISIAAGVPLQKLLRWSGGHQKIARVMPNLPSQVSEGISVWKAAPCLTSKEKNAIKRLLNSFGKSIEVRSEKLIDIATAVSGGGPAYTAAFLESFSDAAQKIGFAKPEARLLALQTVRGSISYIEKTGVEFSDLKKAVQTKGGTTEAGFKVLKKKKWQTALKKALFAGYKHARGSSTSS